MLTERNPKVPLRSDAPPLFQAAPLVRVSSGSTAGRDLFGPDTPDDWLMDEIIPGAATEKAVIIGIVFREGLLYSLTKRKHRH